MLIIADNPTHQQTITTLIANNNIQTILTDTITDTLQHLKTTTFDCIIFDMDVEQGSSIQWLMQMQTEATHCKTPVIIYTERELTASEESLLQQCADNLMIKSVGPEHLLEQAALFLQQLETNLPTDKRNLLRMVHDKEAIFSNKKVLIVDDDPRNSFALATILEEKNMEIFAGNNGFEALELLNEHPDIAIVLMDIMMPEMDGYEAIQRIRAQPHFHKLPIIALTAKAMKGDKAKCIEVGANDYLSKPVNTNKLISLMHVWLHR
jgi:CheY-like chemotaxis protein